MDVTMLLSIADHGCEAVKWYCDLQRYVADPALALILGLLVVVAAVLASAIHELAMKTQSVAAIARDTNALNDRHHQESLMPFLYLEVSVVVSSAQRPAHEARTTIEYLVTITNKGTAFSLDGALTADVRARGNVSAKRFIPAMSPGEKIDVPLAIEMDGTLPAGTDVDHAIKATYPNQFGIEAVSRLVATGSEHGYRFKRTFVPPVVAERVSDDDDMEW